MVAVDIIGSGSQQAMLLPTIEREDPSPGNAPERMGALTRGARSGFNSNLRKRPQLAMPPTIALFTSRGALFACLVAFSAFANSQPADPRSPAEPSNPHEALAFYEGTWTLVGKAPEAYRETCSWLPEGRRHIVCRSREQAASGPREHLGVYSYDESKGEYLSHVFGASGAMLIERGQRIPGGFHFTSERGTGANRVRTRFTIVEAEQGRVNTFTETAKVDGPWVAGERSVYLRTKP